MTWLPRLGRKLLWWGVVPLLVTGLLLAGCWLLFPVKAKKVAAWSMSQIAIRGLALRSGTGWPGGSFDLQANVHVPMRDGVRLSTDLYLPTSGGPFPAIAVRTPYGKGEGRLIAEFFARYGYAVVVQDTRGRHKSEGEFYPFRSEMEDGCDFTAWIRRQPWCNGSVGGFGASYLGFTQWAAAVGNPHLASISPTFIAGNLHSALYKGGAFGQLTYLHWSLSSYGRWGDGDGAKNVKRGYGHFPLIESDNAALRDIGFYNDWVSHPEPSGYWRSMSPTQFVEKISTPAFMTAGWYDFMLDGQIRDFQRIRGAATPEASAGTKILIGPWSHTFFNRNLKNYGIEPRSLEMIPFTYVKESKDWLDFSLKGIDNGWDRRPAVRAYVLGANEWRDVEDWPPPEAAERTLYLHSRGDAQTLHGNGSLSTAPPETDEPEDSFVFDPADPVPTRGGGHGDFWTAGPADQREVEERPDVLVYTAAGLNSPLLVMGNVRARVFASSTAPDTDFTAKLVDVFPDGRALIVCEGILRTRYRETPGQPRPLPPGSIVPLDIELGPTAVSFRSGHRIRLEISSSNAPRYDVNPNTGTSISTERNHAVATQRVFHAPSSPSALILPVVEDPQ